MGRLTFTTVNLNPAKIRTGRLLKTLEPGARVIGNLKVDGGLLLAGGHPDDLTLSMGSLAFAGFEPVTALTFTRGVPGNDRLLPAIAEAVCLRADQLIVGDAADGEGPGVNQGNVDSLWRVILNLSPAVVVTHLPVGDPHPCHGRVSELVRRAIFRMPRHTRPCLLYARPPAQFDERRFRPDIHVSLSRGLALLLAKAIELHPSECTKAYYKADAKVNVLALQAAQLDPHGLTGEFEFLESFMTDR